MVSFLLSSPQVTAKAGDLQRVIQSCPDDVSRTYASLTLAKKLLSQAEVQVCPLPTRPVLKGSDI